MRIQPQSFDRPVAGEAPSVMKDHVLIAVRMTAVFLVLCCGIYPAAVWGIGRIAFRSQADGSRVIRAGQVVGSRLIGQKFTSARFFHPRPSAAGPDGYDGMGSSGSNLGPTSKALRDRIGLAVVEYRDVRPLGRIPADALTTSGSGLDPHISLENATAQGPRVARENGMTPSEVDALIAAHTEGRFLGIFGEPRVNVLELNLALVDRPESRNGK